VEIVNHFLIPDITKNYTMNNTDVCFPPEIVTHLIETVEEKDGIGDKSGVRNLKNVLDKIMKRINFYRLVAVNGRINFDVTFSIDNFSLPFTLTKDFVDKVIKDIKRSETEKSVSHQMIYS
jgi:ATP-dependent Lon protease